MGILKKLIDKVLNAEVPPVVEQVVKKGLAKNCRRIIAEKYLFSIPKCR
jgi:hypothetical protein